MPKKRKPAAALTAKLIKLPSDWIDAVDAVRGDLSFSEYVRQAIAEKLGPNAKDLSEVTAWGQGRWKTE